MEFGEISHGLLDQLKAKAKQLAKQDKSRTYVQWLNSLAQEYGARTFELLQARLADLEREANINAEKLIWQQRLNTGSLRWGTLGPVGPANLTESDGLPIFRRKEVPWPNCFIDAALFTAAEGPRRQLDGQLPSLEGSPEVFFHGEELRCGEDQIVLMAIMSFSGRAPCGQLLEFSVQDLEAAIGFKLHEMGIPVEVAAITRSLWRFTHCKLRIDRFSFAGPFIVFADVQQAPEKFRVRFNPSFSNFFSPHSIFDDLFQHVK